jgi:hypothetical protein
MTRPRTKTAPGYKYDHSKWICHGCLKCPCQCRDCEDTTIVEVLSFEDEPTRVYVRSHGA